MMNKEFFSLLTFVFSMLLSISVLADSRVIPEEILIKIDGPLLDKPTKSIIEITQLYKDQKRSYLVKSDGQSRTIIEFLDIRQKGQKVLSTNTGMWFISNKTRKAIRIPATQRLFGDASFGDIARLKFSQDYLAVLVDQDLKRANYSLHLTSNSRSATYKKIILSVSKIDFSPISAKLYSSSGKYLKAINYVDVESQRDNINIKRIHIYDPNRPKRITEVKFINTELIQINPIEFTKKYLQLSR